VFQEASNHALHWMAIPPRSIDTGECGRWASTYVKKAGLLEATRKGFYQLTDRGRDLLKKRPKNINVKLLEQYPEFLEFRQIKGTRSGDKVAESKWSLDISTATPLEALENAYINLRDELADELLARLKKICPPSSNGLLWNCWSKWATEVRGQMQARQSVEAVTVELMGS